MELGIVLANTQALAEMILGCRKITALESQLGSAAMMPGPKRPAGEVQPDGHRHKQGQDLQPPSQPPAPLPSRRLLDRLTHNYTLCDGTSGRLTGLLIVLSGARICVLSRSLSQYSHRRLAYGMVIFHGRQRDTPLWNPTGLKR